MCYFREEIKRASDYYIFVGDDDDVDIYSRLYIYEYIINVQYLINDENIL